MKDEKITIEDVEELYGTPKIFDRLGGVTKEYIDYLKQNDKYKNDKLLEYRNKQESFSKLLIGLSIGFSTMVISLHDKSTIIPKTFGILISAFLASALIGVLFFYCNTRGVLGVLRNVLHLRRDLNRIRWDKNVKSEQKQSHKKNRLQKLLLKLLSCGFLYNLQIIIFILSLIWFSVIIFIP